MADINLTSTTGSGFLETDFDQIKDLFQDGGVEALVFTAKDSGFFVADNADITKKIAFQASGITTATTRTITMPDQDVDLTPGTGTFATAAEGDLAATAMQNLIDDTTPQLGGDLDLNSNNITAAGPTTISSTEVSYLDGVTSNIQTQIDGKLSNVVEDTTPQLGGNLDGNGNNFTTTIADTSNIIGLGITQNDTTNNPNAVNITNTGTGDGIFIDQNGDGYPLEIDNDGNTHSLVMNTATGRSFSVSHASTGNWLAVLNTSNASNTVGNLQLVNAGTGPSLEIDHNGASGDAIYVQSGGNISIGQTGGLRELDIAGDIVQNDGTNAYLWNIDGSGNYEFWYQTTYSGGDSGWTQAMEIAPDGTGFDFKQAVTVSSGDLKAQAGDISGGIFTESHSASHTLTNTECYGAVYYVDAAATLTLPAVADGMSLTVVTVGAVAVSVDANASDKIWLDGVALDDGDKITNTSTSGDIAVLTYYSADGWYASTNGWTDGGA